MLGTCQRSTIIPLEVGHGGDVFWSVSQQRFAAGQAFDDLCRNGIANSVSVFLVKGLHVDKGVGAVKGGLIRCSSDKTVEPDGGAGCQTFQWFRVFVSGIDLQRVRRSQCTVFRVQDPAQIHQRLFSAGFYVSHIYQTS